MDARAAELARRTVRERLADAQIEAEEEARAAATEAASDESSDESTTTTDGSQPGVDDDDVEVAPNDTVTIDPATVLASLYPGLPIDSDGVCVPVERVEAPLGGDAVLSGRDPRFVRVESIVDQDGDYVATLSIQGEKFFVGTNDSFASTLQVLAVEEDRVILYHSDKWCPVRSVGVIEDPRDGSIIAMGSYPDYDPSVFVEGLSDEQWASLSTAFAFQNFAVQGLYAPASTFKTVPYILAVEENFYPIDRGLGDKEVGDEVPVEDAVPVALQTHTDEYSCTGEFKFTLNDGTVQTKRDWKWPGGHGPLDLHGALQASCDLYFWDVALRLWEERGDDSGFDKENLLQEYARAFGFGTASGIDLPFERDGLIPDRTWFSTEQAADTGRVREDGPWVGGDLMDIAVGQGATLATPLQLANAYSAMVNGGTLWKPRVVKEVLDSNGDIIDDNPKEIINTIDLNPLTVQLLRSDLQQVVNNQERGTGRTAFANFGPNVELVGGKSGTGEVISARGAADFEEVDNAWFVGVAPINNPQYVVSVVVERGGSGGQIAAPIVRQILQYLLNGPEGVTPLAKGLDAD
jgi:penicillin-binding protein 2